LGSSAALNHSRRKIRQREVEQRLQTALKQDRARVQLGRISRFGLMEMSRQRLRASLGESSQIVCPRCQGHGRMRSVESLSLSIIRVAEEHAMKDNTGQVLVQTPVEIANYLLNEKRGALAEIEKRHTTPVVIVADQHLHTPHYQVTRLRESELGEEANRPSYQRGTTRKLPTIALTKTQVNLPPPAAVSNILPSRPTPARDTRIAPAPDNSTQGVATTANGGLLGWFKRMFAGATATPDAVPSRTARHHARNGRGEPQRDSGRNRRNRRERDLKREQPAVRTEILPAHEPTTTQPPRQPAAVGKPPPPSKKSAGKSAPQPRKSRNPKQGLAATTTATNAPVTNVAATAPDHHAAPQALPAAVPVPAVSTSAPVLANSVPVTAAAPTPAAAVVPPTIPVAPTAISGSVDESLIIPPVPSPSAVETVTATTGIIAPAIVQVPAQDQTATASGTDVGTTPDGTTHDDGTDSVRNRRRRGHRGGRRRRRSNGADEAAAVGTEPVQVFNHQTPDTSTDIPSRPAHVQPEFDFNDLPPPAHQPASERHTVQPVPTSPAPID